MPTICINPVLRFDTQERGIIEEALRPFRVLTGEEVENPRDTELYQKLINRLNGELRSENLLDLHRGLLELREVVQRDGENWEVNAKTAPKESEGIIMRPQESFLALAEIRRHQANILETALATVRRSMEVLNPLTQECRKRAASLTADLDAQRG